MISAVDLGEWPPTFHAFHRWWDRLSRRGHLVPRASELDKGLPAELRTHMFFFERKKGGDFEVLWAGKGLSEVSSEPLQETNYLSRFPQEQAAMLAECFGNICGQPCGGDLIRTVRQRGGIRFQFRHLMLPMADDDGVVSYVVGIIDWFSITDKKNERREKSDGSIDQAIYIDIGSGLPDEG